MKEFKILSDVISLQSISAMVENNGIGARSVFEGIVSINFDDTNEVISRITIDLDESINAESYQLSVSDGGISISSADSAGALYALQSLKQIFLISKLEDTPLKFIEVNDSPKFSYRGMLLDISRNFYGPEKIKQIIDYLLSLIHI